MIPIARLNPLFAPINRRLLGPPKPEVEVLQEEETETVVPPAFLPGMLERAIGTDEHSVLSDHLETATQTKVVHAPVLRYTYRNALVSRSGFATFRHIERYGNEFRTVGLSNRPIEVPELRYCHTYVAWRYFGHWLTDSIPAAFLEPDRGELWMPPNPSWEHSPPYLEALDLTPRETEVVLADTLTVYQDYGQGSQKRARFATILKDLHARFGNGGDAEETLFIKRGATGVARTFSNEEQLLEQLSARNWRILDVATASVEEIQKAVCQARVVVSIDGSHLDHAHLSLRPGSVMVVLVPQDRFTLRQLGLSRAHDVSPGFVVVEGNQSDGYTVDLGEILKTVELAEAQVDRL
ncbi:MAG: glycosyltransferase family 61 protein [Pseudomonadota bacterium]